MEAVEGADIVALCASLNDASHRMFGAAEIARIRPGGFVVNVARAQLVDFAAMPDALRSAPPVGVGSDARDPDEPLPPWSGVWSVPNLLITPHVTPRMPDR